MLFSTETKGTLNSSLPIATIFAVCSVIVPACTTIVTETPTGYDVRMKAPFTRTSTHAKAMSEPHARNHVPYDNALEADIDP